MMIENNKEFFKKASVLKDKIIHKYKKYENNEYTPTKDEKRVFDLFAGMNKDNTVVGNVICFFEIMNGLLEL